MFFSVLSVIKSNCRGFRAIYFHLILGNGNIMPTVKRNMKKTCSFIVLMYGEYTLPTIHSPWNLLQVVPIRMQPADLPVSY